MIVKSVVPRLPLSTPPLVPGPTVVGGCQVIVMLLESEVIVPPEDVPINLRVAGRLPVPLLLLVSCTNNSTEKEPKVPPTDGEQPAVHADCISP